MISNVKILLASVIICVMIICPNTFYGQREKSPQEGYIILKNRSDLTTFVILMYTYHGTMTGGLEPIPKDERSPKDVHLNHYGGIEQNGQVVFVWNGFPDPNPIYLKPHKQKNKVAQDYLKIYKYDGKYYEEVGFITLGRKSVLDLYDDKYVYRDIFGTSIDEESNEYYFKIW